MNQPTLSRASSVVVVSLLWTSASLSAQPETGACCFEIGVCLDGGTPAGCESVGGRFLGSALTCFGDPDLDGVAGCADLCPLDSEKVAPGLCGCAVSDSADGDEDGVIDCVDECPDTPPFIPVTETGCIAAGACCFFNGACFELAEAGDCQLVGGVYQGHESQCAQGCFFPESGDADGNGRLGIEDLMEFPVCMLGPVGPQVQQSCRIYDLNGDIWIDLIDFGFFQTRFASCLPEPDDDGDGFSDGCDNCPTVWSFNHFDSDDDGIGDACDVCPESPRDEFPVDIDGCSDSQRDSDGDGVIDELDLCPNTPGGVTVYANGCAPSQVDTDGDGVPDANDQCPNTPPADRPNVNAQGCGPSQLDADTDGVPDSTDNCRTTANPTQTDGDGDLVGDACDACPGTPPGTEVTSNGCPRPIRWRSTQKLIQETPGAVYFTPETYDLTAAGVLASAELSVSETQARQLHGGTQATKLASRVEQLGVPVAVYRVNNAGGSVGATLTESVRIDTFQLSIAGNQVTWTFSVIVTDTLPSGGFTDEFVYSYAGTQTGTVSTAGGQQVITWNSVQGQYDYSDTLGGMDSKALSSFYFLGRWTGLP